VSPSLVDVATTVVVIISVAILALGTFRALQIGRYFVNRTYRLRAYWGGALMFVIMLGTLLNFVSFPNSALGDLLSFAPFGVIILFLMAFVDQGIFVAMDGDFFHRDILLWRSTRRAVYAVLILSEAVELASYLLAGQSASASGSAFVTLGEGQNLAVVPILFAYAVAALVIGGRRTADRTMKKHIRLLGYGFFCFIVAFPFFASTDLGFLFANTLIVFANLFLYLAVMSFSSVGRVEKEPGAPGAAVAPQRPK
jgi:hypothetical protein